MTNKELKVSAIKEGSVIDHIPSVATFKVVSILNLQNNPNVITVATNLLSKGLGKKGIVKVGGKSLTRDEVDAISIQYRMFCCFCSQSCCTFNGMSHHNNI